VEKRRPPVCPQFVRRLIEITSRQQQTQRMLLDRLRVEYGTEAPSTKLLAIAELDSEPWLTPESVSFSAYFTASMRSR
jgi:hypothetical protein